MIPATAPRRRTAQGAPGAVYDGFMRPSSTSRGAFGFVLGTLLIAGLLVVTTDLRVEHLGPVIIFAVALAGVVALLLAPPGKAD